MLQDAPRSNGTMAQEFSKLQNYARDGKGLSNRTARILSIEITCNRNINASPVLCSKVRANLCRSTQRSPPRDSLCLFAYYTPHYVCLRKVQRASQAAS